MTSGSTAILDDRRETKIHTPSPHPHRFWVAHCHAVSFVTGEIKPEAPSVVVESLGPSGRTLDETLEYSFRHYDGLLRRLAD